MSKNVVSFVGMKDKMSGPADPAFHQLNELLERLEQKVASFCLEMHGVIESDTVSGKDQSALILCQLGVLQDVLRAIASLTTILPRTARPHIRGR